MKHRYDLFERFPDGSSLWRACVVGLKGSRWHVRDLARRSSNQFYAMHLESGKIIPLTSQPEMLALTPKALPKDTAVA